MQSLAVTAKTVITACGKGQQDLLEALQQGRSGLRRQRIPGLGFESWIGKVGAVDEVEFKPDLQDFKCRNNQLAQMALDHDNFLSSVESANNRYGEERIGLFIGTSTSGIAETEKAYRAVQQDADRLPDDFKFMETHNIASLLDYVQQVLGLQGPGHTISTACSSSAKVFAAAYRSIACGQCDAAVVGGVDSLCLTTLYGFNALQLISDGLCKPFDINRSGINIGEAAGFVLLEPDDAANRQLKLKGYGESSDAYHMSSPHPEGRGAVQAITRALENAALQADDIDYINLHGTATLNNDSAEAQGVFKIFGGETLCSSTKGFTGHTLGAAGITEAIITLLALEYDFVPGNLNLERYDPEVRLNIPQENQKARLTNVMSNNFGFGGTNCSLIFGW